MGTEQRNQLAISIVKKLYEAWLKSFIESLVVFLNKDKSPTDEVRYQLYILTAAVVVTALLMWSYSFNTYFTIKSYYGLEYLCFVYSAIHLFSPLLYRYFSSIPLCTHVFISAGFCFQFHHALATGGFHSNTIIWFSILPLIVGIVARRKDLFIWATIATLGVFLQALLTFLGIGGEGFNSWIGPLWTQYNISLGYILINCALILLYIKSRDHHKMKLDDKNVKIRNLVRMLSHDISNPLFLIQTNLSRVNKNNNNELIRKNIGNMMIGVDAIKQIVNSVRQLEMYEMSEKKLDIGPVNLKKEIEDALIIFKERIEDKEIDISSNIYMEGSSLLISANESTFKYQVICNLLSNAIKFSPKGGKIIIEAKNAGKEVLLTISDQGIGMSESLIENLFNFEAGNSRPGTQGERGTGHGMPILKSILDKIGGRIEIESRCIRTNPANSGTSILLYLKKI